MQYKAHDYQAYASEFIITHPACGLLLDMGLGKTIITLTALWALVLDYFEVGRILIIAPLRVARDTWPKEIEKWDHLNGLTYSVVVGSEKERREALSKTAFIYIINRENVSWLIDNGYYNFDCCVIDELSSFKCHQSKRFKSLRKVRPTVKRIVGLTGTPTPNGLIDLWAQINLLDMGERLGRFIGGYRDRYFMPDKRNRDVIFSYKPKEGAEEAIYEKISDICVSMKAADHLNMPELVVSNLEVVMSENEQKQYDQLKTDLILPFEDGDIDAASAVGLSNKLHQMANGAVYDENGNIKEIHQRKLDALEDLIEAANGQPILIAYWYRHDRVRLMQRFGAIPIDTTENINKWNERKISIAIIQPASCGLGLNLQMGYKFQQGIPHLNAHFFMGYDKDEDGKLVINKEQAVIVRRIYDSFLQGLTPGQIAEELNDQGIVGVKGVVGRSNGTILGMLNNEKYKGDSLMQKTYTADYLTKKRVKNEGEMDQYYVKNSHEAIISEELWETVQLELSRRDEYKDEIHIRNFGSHRSDSPFISKIVCAKCGRAYGRRSWKNRNQIVWKCTGKEKDKEDCCCGENINERALYRAFRIAWNSIVEQREDYLNRWKDQTESDNPLVKLRANQMMELTEAGKLFADVPEQIAMVLERIIILHKDEMTVRFLDESEKKVRLPRE